MGENKKVPDKPAIDTARANLEKPTLNPEMRDKLKAGQLDIMRNFVKVFNNPEGQAVLIHLDKYSHRNFPNYDNVNATFSKCGEQAIVSYIRDILNTAKKGGE